MDKNGAQLGLIKKMATNVCRSTRRPRFGDHHKNGLGEKIFAQKVAQKFFVQVWGNSGKNLSHPQKLLAPYTWGCVGAGAWVHLGVRLLWIRK